MFRLRRQDQPKIHLGVRSNSIPLWPTNLSLHADDYRLHQWVIGISRSGKTGYLETQILQLIKHGIGMSFVDPAGDAAEDILRILVAEGFFALPDALDRLWYFEFEEDENAAFPAFNVLNQPTVPANVVASQVLEGFHRTWPALAAGAAPMFDTLLLLGTKILIHNHLPLPALFRLLTERAFRDSLLERVPDPDLVSYFHENFDHLGRNDAVDAVQSAIRRLVLLTFSPVLRYALGQSENILDFSRFMNTKMAVIYNLGKVQSQEARRLIGGLIAKGYEDAAFARQALPAESRFQHHLILDEFAEFSNTTEQALSRFLSQTRKFGLFCTLAHQTFSQTSKRLQGALQNAELNVAFRVGREDGEILAKQLFDVDVQRIKSEPMTERSQPVFAPLLEQWEVAVQALTNQRPRRAWVRVGAESAVPIRTLTLSNARVDQARVDEIRSAYREKLMRPKRQILLPYQATQSVTTTTRTSPRRSKLPP